MKRFIVLAICLALVLSACGAAGTDVTATAAPEASTSPSPPPTQTPEPTPEPTPSATPFPDLPADEMVKLIDIIPDIYTDVRYASENNFTGEAVYDTDEVYLRFSTACKLAGVQEALRPLGYSLCVWDGWRSVPAQFALWRACPDPTYVSDPFNGMSNHCRGNTVDITLVTLDGGSVGMPTDFDDFSALADCDYSDVSEEAAANARLLEDAMTAAGFTGYSAEWWHYTDTDAYDVCELLTEPETLDIEHDTQMYTDTNYISTVCGFALAGERVRVLDRVGDYLLIRGGAGYGYIRAQA